MNKRITIGQIVAIGAALLVLLCFFFPWIEFNLLLVTANVTGFQLATGNGPAGASFPSVASLLLVPLSMIGVLVIVSVCFAGQGASQLKSIASVLLIAAGGLSVLVILYQYFNLNAELNRNVLGFVSQKMFSYSFGAHGSLIGSLVVAGAGLLDLIGAESQPSKIEF